MQLIATKKVQDERYNICKKCDRLGMMKLCKECGCLMPLKVKIPGADCPLGKWSKTTSTTYEESGTWGKPQEAECCAKHD